MNEFALNTGLWADVLSPLAHEEFLVRTCESIWLRVSVWVVEDSASYTCRCWLLAAGRSSRFHGSSFSALLGCSKSAQYDWFCLIQSFTAGVSTSALCVHICSAVWNHTFWDLCAVIFCSFLQISANDSSYISHCGPFFFLGAFCLLVYTQQGWRHRRCSEARKKPPVWCTDHVWTQIFGSTACFKSI